MIQIKILRSLRADFNTPSRKLTVEEILNAKWIYSDRLYEFYLDKENYFLFMPEMISLEFFHNDYFDDYELSEEQFEFLKIKLL